MMANSEEAKQIGEVAHKERFFFYLRFLTSFRRSQDFIRHQPVYYRVALGMTERL